MARGDLTDIEWQRLEPLMPSQNARKRGGQFKDHRTVINGILWIMRTGAPWRDLPERYGPWQSCYSRFSRWSRTGVWQRIVRTLHADEDIRESSDLPLENAFAGGAPPPLPDDTDAVGGSRLGTARGQAGSAPIPGGRCAVSEEYAPSSLLSGRGAPSSRAWESEKMNGARR